MTRIVFLDRDSLPVPLPVFAFPHELQTHASTEPDQVLERCADADIVISNKVAMPRQILQQLPRLKMLAIAATGVNHIDLDACREVGVVVSNVRHYGDASVAEHALMLMLALMKNLPAYQQDLRAGAWSRAAQFCHFGAPIRTLAGATLCIAGSGGIGQALALRARAFDMRVHFVEHKGATQIRDGYLAFDQALAQADILSLHCPLTEDTRLMIAARELARMKPDAILINTARGGLVHEADLLAALQAGRLGGAALDVLAQEPPAADSLLLGVDLPNLIITPHVAWASNEAMAALAGQVVENIAAHVAGQPIRRVI